MKLHMTHEAIAKATVSVTKRAGTLQADIHKTAVSIFSLWQKGRGIEAAQVAAKELTALQNASPYHADAFSKWVGAHCQLHWADETKTWFAHVEESHVFTGKQFEAARDLPFFIFKKPSAPKPFDMFDALESILNRATSASKKGNATIDAKAVNLVRQAVEAQAAAVLAAEQANPGEMVAS